MRPKYFLKFCEKTATDLGDTRHPQVVMRDISKRNEFEILDSKPYSSCWIFRIDRPVHVGMRLPAFLRYFEEIVG